MHNPSSGNRSFDNLRRHIKTSARSPSDADKCCAASTPDP